jgi:TPR repeat protein
MRTFFSVVVLAATLSVVPLATSADAFTLSVVVPSADSLAFDEGVAAYKAGDYVKAVELWQPLAEQGVANAQYNLGIMYDNGEGVKQDYAEAAKWYRQPFQGAILFLD